MHSTLVRQNQKIVHVTRLQRKRESYSVHKVSHIPIHTNGSKSTTNRERGRTMNNHAAPSNNPRHAAVASTSAPPHALPICISDQLAPKDTAEKGANHYMQGSTVPLSLALPPLSFPFAPLGYSTLMPCNNLLIPNFMTVMNPFSIMVGGQDIMNPYTMGLNTHISPPPQPQMVSAPPSTSSDTSFSCGEEKVGGKIRALRSHLLYNNASDRRIMYWTEAEDKGTPSFILSCKRQ
jgi:hypothetical protein